MENNLPKAQMEYLGVAYRALNKVFIEKKYLDDALTVASKDATATKIIYGVLEKNFQAEYVIGSLCKVPDLAVGTLLKIGYYCLLYMDSLPDYAVVNGVVELSKKTGKAGLSGLINAVLKKISRREYKLPEDEMDKLCFESSKPKWFAKYILSKYDYETAISVLNSEPCEEEHIRANNRLCDLTQIEKMLSSATVEYQLTMAGGLKVKNCATVKNMFSEGVVTFQSPSSMLVCSALQPYGRVLDLCAAPGGKAVYLSELDTKCEVVACDINSRKINQIKSYAKRMCAPNVKAVINDGTVFNKDFENAFDCVLVDAPCSCFGTFRKHPDTFLRHDYSTVKQMSALQKKIVSNGVKYLKSGGTLVYSTCTLFKEENEDIVKYILKTSDLKLDKMNIPLKNEGEVNILPLEEFDGFFIARFVKP